ncbi:MAG: ankyrin repeat domain-containing protein [Gemmatimonadaceae bacterium]
MGASSLGRTTEATARRRPRGRAEGAVSVTRLLDAARHWDAGKVAAAVQQRPALASATDRNGRTALHVCAGATAERTRRPPSAAVATARALLAAGAHIDAVHDIRDRTESFPARALWHAIARGRNRTLARFLLRQGANADYCLWSVVWDDDLATARLLLAHGANLDLTFHGETSLLYATRLRRTRMMRWLLRNGADVNLADVEGRTPLFHAVRRRFPLAQVEELLRHGADPARAAADGASPLSLVAGARAQDLARLLRKYVPAAR